jgi:poly-beta-1,6-N-acetyl-D-glucosamine synthase
MEIVFWICIFLIFYTYVGYFFLLKIWSFFYPKTEIPHKKDLSLSFIIPAYNEAHLLAQKIKNTLEQSYPQELMEIIVVADGSNDNSEEVVKQFPNVKYFHIPERQGKTMAMNRAVPLAKGEIILFSDANTLINKDAVTLMLGHFDNAKVGAVAGEKRILTHKADAQNAQGEGFYWKYESAVKQLEYQIYSVIGAAGELFAVRRSLFHELPSDTILDDFMQTMLIADKGYRIAYEPNAYAEETASINTKEEWKRKVRICAGGWQSISRLPSLLNVFKHGTLSVHYISHKVIRWAITPSLMVLAFILNLLLVGQAWVYEYTLFGQIMMYTFAFIGFLHLGKLSKLKLFMIPYYFVLMNASTFSGALRFLRKKQSAVWEKAKR